MIVQIVFPADDDDDVCYPDNCHHADCCWHHSNYNMMSHGDEEDETRVTRAPAIRENERMSGMMHELMGMMMKRMVMMMMLQKMISDLLLMLMLKLKKLLHLEMYFDHNCDYYNHYYYQD